MAGQDNAAHQRSRSKQGIHRQIPCKNSGLNSSHLRLDINSTPTYIGFCSLPHQNSSSYSTLFILASQPAHWLHCTDRIPISIGRKHALSIIKLGYKELNDPAALTLLIPSKHLSNFKVPLRRDYVFFLEEKGVDIHGQESLFQQPGKWILSKDL